jgi:Ca2+/Na+ antiporter
MAATTIILPISNITKNQINQALINIALGLVLILMNFLYFNFIFGIFSVILLTFIMYTQVKKKSLNLEEINKSEYSIFLSVFLIIIGVIFLIYGSDLLISSSINIASNFNVSETVIGLSIIALGTSLPELVVGVISALKKKVDFALGNILGSNIYNVLGVLGISSFFGTFEMPNVLAKQDLIFMLLITFIILAFMFFAKKIGRAYGCVGFILYISYIYYILS